MMARLHTAISAASQQALDRPIWSALTTQHRHLARGDAWACRYPADVAPFAATGDDSAAAFTALRDILLPGEQCALFTLAGVDSRPGLQTSPLGTVDQMVATQMVPPTAAPGVVRLGTSEAPAMRALATLTKPGPFGPRTHELGEFVGMWQGDQLVAMAGERMHLQGYVEVSAVCVHPDHRGKGYARTLVTTVMANIARRGSTPFLHVLTDNHGAIALYNELGFVRRQQLVINTIWRVEA